MLQAVMDLLFFLVSRAIICILFSFYFILFLTGDILFCRPESFTAIEKLYERGVFDYLVSSIRTINLTL